MVRKWHILLGIFALFLFFASGRLYQFYLEENLFDEATGLYNEAVEENDPFQLCVRAQLVVEVLLLGDDTPETTKWRQLQAENCAKIGLQ